MTVYSPPICLACRHLKTDSVPLACKAFPDGIPEAITTWEVVHDVPYEGDHGIQFQPDAKAPFTKADLLEMAAE